MKSYFILFLVMLTGVACGQRKYDANWCFGVKAGINFRDTLHPINFPTLGTNYAAAASISDSLGNLLFYVAPDTPFNIIDDNRNVAIYTGSNNVCRNGDSIVVGGYILGAIFLPVGDDYLFLYTKFVDSISSGGNPTTHEFVNLYDALISKDSNGYFVKYKNRLISAEPLEFSLTAAKHANGKDWWLLMHKSNQTILLDSTNGYCTFLVTTDTIQGPIVQNIGTYHKASDTNSPRMTFSSNGNSVACPMGIQNSLDIFNFNRCTGILSDWKVLSNIDSIWNNPDIYSCEFSLDATKLYISEGLGNNGQVRNLVYQYEINQPNISNSRKIVWQDTAAVPQFAFGDLRRAPNGKIYLGLLAGPSAPYQLNDYNQNNQYLWVINNPDSLGGACNFQPYGYYLGDSARTYYALPNIPNYNLGPLNSVWQASAGNNTFVCSNKDTSKAYIGVSSVTGVTYAWQPATGITDTTLPQQTVRPDSSRWYYLTLTDTSITGSCTSRLDSVFVEVKVCDTIGINEIEASNIKVYPNPANTFITIEWQQNSQVAKLALLNILAEEVVNTSIGVAGNKISLNSYSLPNGLYIIRLQQNDGKTITVRIVIEH